jgi:uncharacterized membrane-anchored protein YjiN (DUF445 family)
MVGCNKTFKFQEVCQLVETRLGKVTAERWQDVVHHIIQEDQQMWKLDGLTDNIVEQLVINGRDDETFSDLFDSNSDE